MEERTIYEKIKNYLETNSKVNIAFALLFVSSMLILAQIQENISDVNVKDLEILTSDTFIVFGVIVILSIVIYSIVDLFFDKSDHDRLSKDLSDKLHLIENMLKMKGLDTIVTDKEIEEEEKKSEEIILILEDLYLDISPIFKDEFNTEKNVGSYSPEVHTNIKNGKQYTYYLKYDNNTHTAIELHMKSHYNKLKENKQVKEPIFILIPSTEYSFFSDIYIYSDKDGRRVAYEYLPSLKREDIKDHMREEDKKSTLYYLQFDPDQVQRLGHILSNTRKKYGVTTASAMQKDEDYIVNQSVINNVEEKANSIQIVTQTLHDDLKDGLFFDAVNKNLKEQKKYTYFLPDKLDIEEQIINFEADHGKLIEFCTFVKIPENRFLFYSNIFIYDNNDAYEFIPVTNQYFKCSLDQSIKLRDSLHMLKKEFYNGKEN